MVSCLVRRVRWSRAPSAASGGSRLWAVVTLLGLIGLGLGGCAQQPQQIAAAGHSKEYFPESIYGRASRRVIADGEPVPHGGGQYLVGKPYTVAGQTYYPSERHVTQIGLASWYGDAFHGRLTANGEIYDRDSFTAAHPTMPLPSYARVTNLRNNTSMIVRVNDRGPYHSNRIMDVSRRVAEALDIRRYGTAKVKVEWVARASLAGSDDTKLAATLRTDGPAKLEGVEENIMVAAISAPARIAALGSFFPQPARPPAMVQDQRPERLEAYRAPRVASRATAPTHAVPAEDEADVPRRQERAHLAAPPKPPAPRSREIREILEARATPLSRPSAHQGLKRGDAGLHFAQAELSSRAREMRAPQTERPAPMLRHAATMAQERPKPSVRPSHLAAVLPPVRPRSPAARTMRSRGD